MFAVKNRGQTRSKSIDLLFYELIIFVVNIITIRFHFSEFFSVGYVSNVSSRKSLIEKQSLNVVLATLSKIELKLYGTLEDPSKFAKLSGNSTYSHAYAQFSRGLQLFREDSMGSDSRSSFVNNTKSFLCVLVVAAVWLNQRILV